MTIHIGMLLFPRLTQLDLTGPFELFHRVPDAKVHLVWKNLDVVRAESGLGLMPTTTLDACPPLDKCNDGVTGAEPAARLTAFTEMFTHGFIGQVCGDYDPFFQEAIATIKSACDEFTPPG